MDESKVDISAINEKIKKESSFIDLLIPEVNKVIIGQKYMIRRLLIALLGKGHILLEGVPGLAKTLAINTLSQAVKGSFSRVQFTPDLLPADVIGTMIYNMKENDFSIKKGPIFANFVLADEINRAPAKVQSALLEAMQEKQVTIGDNTFKLQLPFLVMATQNPIEQEGTYPLPEAQMDRFLFKTVLTYPSMNEEKEIIKRFQSGFPTISQPVIPIEQLSVIQEASSQIYIDDKVSEYVVRLINATRNPAEYGLNELSAYIRCGASPRASIAFIAASKAYAFLQRRNYVIPEDIKHLAYDVLRHRLLLTFAAEAESMSADKIIESILGNVEVP